jgi:hypothetical protein
MKETLDSYHEYVSLKEPLSNRGLEVFKTQNDIDAEKAAEKAKADKAIKEAVKQKDAKKPAEGAE